jgi:hypothetical protein
MAALQYNGFRNVQSKPNVDLVTITTLAEIMVQMAGAGIVAGARKSCE